MFLLILFADIFTRHLILGRFLDGIFLYSQVSIVLLNRIHKFRKMIFAEGISFTLFNERQLNELNCFACLVQFNNKRYTMLLHIISLNTVFSDFPVGETPHNTENFEDKLILKEDH